MATIRLFPIEVSEMVFGTLLLRFSVPRNLWMTVLTRDFWPNGLLLDGSLQNLEQTFKLGLVYVKWVKVQQLDYFLYQICPETDFGGLLKWNKRQAFHGSVQALGRQWRSSELPHYGEDHCGIMCSAQHWTDRGCNEHPHGCHGQEDDNL